MFREAKRLSPTETGELVNDLLMGHFSDLIDIGFTATLEDDLDHVAEGRMPWVDVIKEFYTPFSAKLKLAQVEMPETKAEPEKVGRDCPRCGHELVIRWGRFGKFVSCSDFPKCRYTEPILNKIGVICPKDGGDLVERKTRKNRVFYGCSNYPICDYTSWKKPLAVRCSNCGGMLMVANKKDAQCSQCQIIYSLEEVTDKIEAA